jgi:threonine synthase
MVYKSTRGEEVESSAAAILKGIASDGGLYVPSSFPAITQEDIEDMTELDYKDRAAFVLSKFLTDYTIEELTEYAEKAYSRFDDNDPAPLVKVDDNTYILELWHGPTQAFKDLALTMLPYLMTGARKKHNIDKKTLILVATSGDTGKAALEGFKDIEGAEIVAFYPSEGVSDMQKLQMQTTEGNNVHVIGIEGNFDDAQSAVKAIFNDDETRRILDEAGYMLSSANSINFGRLVPQIAYYISAYVDLLANEEISEGDEINFVVPSGNFGNVLAAYYAGRMGLPIKQLIVASNKNKVLTDFFATGEYDANREFHKTMSPSMDILVSSNLERLLFEMCDRDAEFIKALSKDLKEMGRYEVDVDLLDEKLSQFLGYYSTEEETAEVMDNFFDEYGYLLDPHTAVGMSAYFKYLAETIDGDTATVIVSTANPYKFPQDVYEAVSKSREDNAKKAMKKLYSFTGMDIPEALCALENKAILHEKVISKTEIKDTILALFGKKEDSNG